MVVMIAIIWLVLIGHRLMVIGGFWDPPLRGDGQKLETYGFNLDVTLVPQDQIIPAGFARDAIKALVNPPSLPAESALALKAGHGPLLKPGIRVVGIEINGEARAYPVRIVQLHEVCNDTLGGVPIAVTFNPLCDSAVVFDRRVGSETLEFGVSGLVYNSNVVMFDRRDDEDAESLWSQLQFRAIAGPAAESRRKLIVLPMRVVTLRHWLERYPDSTICIGQYDADRRWKQRYAGDPYTLYYAKAEIPYPLEPAFPEQSKREPFDRITARDDDGVWDVTPYTIGDDMETPIDVHALWFAWHTMHPPSDPGLSPLNE